MEGFVNYYIEEDPENYVAIRGDTDTFRFQLSRTKVCNCKVKPLFKYDTGNRYFHVQVSLTDPVQQKLSLSLAQHGVQIAECEARTQLGTEMDEVTRLQYETEVGAMLRAQLPSVEEVVFFDHNIRWENNTVVFYNHIRGPDIKRGSRVATLLRTTPTATWSTIQPWRKSRGF